MSGTAWNAGTCLYMAWAGLGCLMQCINSIVWNKNMIDKAPVYCDISTRIQVALNVAIPACMVAINRRLYKIVSATAVVMPTRAEKRRAVITDLVIGIGIPILEIIAHVVVSGHRYNLFEDFGPYPVVVDMVPSYFLVFGWPVAINAIALVYVVMAIDASYRRRHQFKEIMSCNPGLDRKYFISLVTLSTHIPASFTLGAIELVRGIYGARPWVSWADTHSNYSRVVRFAGFIWKNNPASVKELEKFRWSLVVYAVQVFVSLGIARRTRQNYRRAFTSLASRLNHMISSGAP